MKKLPLLANIVIVIGIGGLILILFSIFPRKQPLTKRQGGNKNGGYGYTCTYHETDSAGNIIVSRSEDSRNHYDSIEAAKEVKWQMQNDALYSTIDSLLKLNNK